MKKETILIAVVALIAGFVIGLLAGRSLAGLADPTPWLLGCATLAAAVAALAGDRATPAALPLLAISGLAIGAAALPEPGPARDVLITTAGTVVASP